MLSSSGRVILQQIAKCTITVFSESFCLRMTSLWKGLGDKKQSVFGSWVTSNLTDAPCQVAEFMVIEAVLSIQWATNL